MSDPPPPPPIRCPACLGPMWARDREHDYVCANAKCAAVVAAILQRPGTRRTPSPFLRHE